ncbi:hypothetical protein LZ24_00593 [Desulfobotulus alkaliphilus]|uniref:Uncharacterized protein n=1 Tax=Desulfobotulus alkaliphilus TaxID=622671 RepID=A0A562S4G6_9BACT|nr:DUF6489 family protein [Desulfobotulus alkaliphilus]TWI75546.1 hypothetical protein LZ24_00593 [Desulfobotulus alkaliphilus]
MKINITIEATPEEIREAMGLPDVRNFHEEVMKDLQARVKAAQDPKELMKIVFPGGDVGKTLWEQTMKNMSLLKPEFSIRQEKTDPDKQKNKA